MGLAGIVGAAAVGIAAGTQAAQRRRREFTDPGTTEIRDRLRDRLAEAKARRVNPGDREAALT